MRRHVDVDVAAPATVGRNGSAADDVCGGCGGSAAAGGGYGGCGGSASAADRAGGVGLR